jgi:integrase
MAGRRAGRVYKRGRRYYGDFRDLGGGQEALIPEGEGWATTDPDVANRIATDRVKELEDRRRNRGLYGVTKRESSLKDYAARHLKLKAKDGEAVRSWLVQTERHLRTAIAFFGSGIDLRAISPEEVTRFVEHLRQQQNGRGGTLTDTSVRKYVNSLSNLYRRALSEQYVNSNPVGDMYAKPTEAKVEPAYLQPDEAALLLESARLYQAPVDDGAFAHMYPLLATFLLTGGRKSEILGLEVDDVSFRLGRVYIRSNAWRRLKTKGSKRSVPLCPQLAEILQEYTLEREQSGGLGSLLFPSSRGEEERMVRDVRKALDRIGKRAGFPDGHIRLHMLRHTYTAARIQTLDRGAPVALYTVARELGHSSTDMIEDRYGHLHDRAVDGASEVVEFRVEHHREKLADRLKALA